MLDNLIGGPPSQKAEIVIPEKTLQKALNEVQKAIVETKKASTSTSL